MKSRRRRRVRINKARFIPFIIVCMIAFLVMLFGIKGIVRGMQTGQQRTIDVEDEIISDCFLSEIILVIDPGHGGVDPGAMGIHNGVNVSESELVLDVSHRLRRLLEPTGIQIIMTREENESISLMNRGRIANEANADFFVSIHLNSHELASVSGTEVFYLALPGAFENNNPTRRHNSQLLAEKLQNRLVEKLQLRDRGIKPRGEDANSTLNIASVITEAGFMSNPSDLAFLASEQGLQLQAEALYLGIMDYIRIIWDDEDWEKCAPSFTTE